MQQQPFKNYSSILYTRMFEKKQKNNNCRGNDNYFLEENELHVGKFLDILQVSPATFWKSVIILRATLCAVDPFWLLCGVAIWGAWCLLFGIPGNHFGTSSAP